MYSLLADVEGSVPTTWREISLEGWDQETLLVDWLNELLYLTETEDLLFVDYEIESLTPTGLLARAGGIPGRVTRVNIKAATFHDLALADDGDRWSAVITFDV
jgi:SHS2 domain-containing protein